jgi:large subunit ribosomal protein L17
MRHRKRSATLGRKPAHRRSLLTNQAVSLILEERIETTVTRAKETRRLAEKLVTLGKKGKLHHRRRAIALLRPSTRVKHLIDGGDIPTTAKQEAVRKLFNELGPRYAERPGGYTRIMRIGQRKGDAAEMCLIEFVEAEIAAPRPKKKRTAKKASAAAAVEEAIEEEVIEDVVDAVEDDAEEIAVAQETVEEAAEEAAEEVVEEAPAEEPAAAEAPAEEAC